jgi:hypothetical protein
MYGDAVTATDPPADWGAVPIRNPDFVGREEHLRHLHDLLAHEEQAAVVHAATGGLGAAGKTQLAIEYVYRYSSEYDLVWWIPSQDRALIRKSLSALADRLGLSEGEDMTATIDAVKKTLSTEESTRWLLVFDNAEHPDALPELLQTHLSPAHMLVTSRHHAWAEVANSTELASMHRDEDDRPGESAAPGVNPARDHYEPTRTARPCPSVSRASPVLMVGRHLAQLRALALTVVFVLSHLGNTLVAIRAAMLRLGQLLRLIMRAHAHTVVATLPGKTVINTPHVTRGPDANCSVSL